MSVQIPIGIQLWPFGRLVLYARRRYAATFDYTYSSSLNSVSEFPVSGVSGRGGEMVEGRRVARLVFTALAEVRRQRREYASTAI